MTIKGALRLSLAWLLVVLPAGAVLAQTSASLVSVETHGNFHAGGVVLTVSGDSDRDGMATLEMRKSGVGGFRAAHPLVRIDSTHFVGSLFALVPGSVYDVRVTVSDPDGVSGSATATQTLATRTGTLAEPTLRTLYVSPGGSDGAAGTSPTTSLRTLQEAADRAQAGDLILVAAGVYRESVTVTASGTAQQPIVFRGDGAGVVLDGADAAIAGGVAWTADGGGIYSRTTGFATGHVVSEAGRLFRYESLAQLQTLAAGAPGGFHFDGSKLHVKFADTSAPGTHTLHVAREENGFYFNGASFVRVENFEIRHFGSGDYGKGVYLRYSDDCAVRSSRIHEIGSAGVWVKGGSRNLIEDNEIWDTSIFGWPWPETKGSSSENNAVTFTDDVGQGHVVRGNTIRGTFNGIGACGDSAPPSRIPTELDFYDNTLSEHTDDAFEPEGYCSNVRIWDNSVKDVHMAFAVAPATVGPTFLLRNRVTGIGNTRTSQLDGYTASALKINSGYPTPIGPLFLYHNTLHTEAPGTNAITLLTPGESTYIVSRNNILSGTRYVIEKVNTVELDWDGDLLYTTDAGRFVRWEGVRRDSLGELQAAEGQELNGRSGDPELAAPGAGDFKVSPSSPAVDHAVLLPGVNDQFMGTGPDIGAVEWSTAIFEDGFESGDMSAWS